MNYGQRPTLIGEFKVDVQEMMFYQDMPIKFPETAAMRYEQRLKPFMEILLAIRDDFSEYFGSNDYYGRYVYLSAKRLFQAPGKPFNRPGWHSDGFMSDDINYIWCDSVPTVFNTSDFDITMDHDISIAEFDFEAHPDNDIEYPVNSLLRLDQYNVHRVGDVKTPGIRTFLKVTFSHHRFNLIGNTHNYLLDYNWDMKPRSISRNSQSNSIVLK